MSGLRGAALIAATAAFGCLTWALVLYGRGAAPGGS